MECRREFDFESCREPMIHIVEEVFRTMLQTQAEARSGTLQIGPNGITAMVQFAGAWQGVLSLQCTSAAAKQLAELFTGGEDSSELDAMCHDVVGELANIVAGNLKVVLPKGTQASLPEVTDGVVDVSKGTEPPIQIHTAIAPNNDLLSLILATGGVQGKELNQSEHSGFSGNK